MVIGAFFSEAGTTLLKAFSDFDPCRDEICQSLIIDPGWSEQDFASARTQAKNYNYYPRISISSKSKILIKQVKNWLNNNYFLSSIELDCFVKDKRGFEYVENRLHINGRKNLQKWMDYISFRNYRHLLRYDIYKLFYRKL